MRKSSFDKFNNINHINTGSNVFNYASSTKNVEQKRLIFQSNIQSSSSPSSSTNNYLQRSISADNVIIKSRGFKPSDIHDPAKRHFLEHLTSKILHFNMDSGDRTSAIDLKKLLTPAMDSCDLLQTKHKKMYASSCFYAPTHPTVEDQVELARRISYSLSDVKNMKSKGQSMYVNRKKRSVKWIHDGNGDEDEEELPSPVHRDKVPLKCMMNPNGKVLDMHCIQALGEELNIGTSPQNAEKLFDIVRDLNNQKGKGAEIFAKRRKRSEKWVVDKEQPPSTVNNTKLPNYPSKTGNGSNENSKFKSPLSPIVSSIEDNSKKFFNPFTMDLSLENQNTNSVRQERRQKKDSMRKNQPEIKKIYLREVAVGTEPEQPINHPYSSNQMLEKSRRISYDYNRHSGLENGNNRCQPKQKQKEIEDIRNYRRYESGPDQNGHRRNNQKDRSAQLDDENELEDYTPVPVKQLIQEFEKTCRPILQYKQMSATKVPVIAHAPLDDISRFFESPRTPNKYEEPTNSSKHVLNGNIMNGNSINNDNYHRIYPSNRNNSLDCHVRYEYDSTDDEIGDSFGESSSSEDNCNDENYIDGMPCFSNGKRLSSMSNCISSASDYDYRRQMFDCASNDLFEAPPGFRNGDQFVNEESDVPEQAKSLLLAGIASQEDILEQIKQLRRTPVLDNFVTGPLSDCSKLDNKMLESTYNGPKISSFQTLTNYNTAPRGWDQSQSFYRPVTFAKPQEPIAYSDF